MTTATVIKATRGPDMAKLHAVIPDASVKGHNIEFYSWTSVTTPDGKAKSLQQIQQDLITGLQAAYDLQVQQEQALTVPATITLTDPA
jgi:hypothetical protein